MDVVELVGVAPDVAAAAGNDKAAGPRVMRIPARQRMDAHVVAAQVFRPRHARPIRRLASGVCRAGGSGLHFLCEKRSVEHVGRLQRPRSGNGRKESAVLQRFKPQAPHTICRAFWTGRGIVRRAEPARDTPASAKHSHGEPPNDARVYRWEVLHPVYRDVSGMQPPRRSRHDR